MRKIVFDIETKNTFQDVGSSEPSALSISVVGIHDSETNKYEAFEEHELGKLWSYIEQADILIGYNSDHFDIPLLAKYYAGDLSRIKSVDLLTELRASAGRRMKLDQVAEGTLGVHKSGHGLQAITWWKAGEIDKIKKYCLDDVKITKRLYDHALKHGKLKYKEGPNMFTVKLDTSKWEAVEKSSMNLSLPF